MCLCKAILIWAFLLPGFSVLGQQAFISQYEDLDKAQFYVEELEREYDVLEQRLPRKGEVRERRLALLVVRRPRRVEEVDDQVGREPREQRDARHAVYALLVKVLQRGRVLRRAVGGGVAARVRRHRAERARELVRVLDRLAAALPEVGHHRVRCVAEQAHAPRRPLELRRPVVPARDDRRAVRARDRRKGHGPT